MSEKNENKAKKTDVNAIDAAINAAKAKAKGSDTTLKVKSSTGEKSKRKKLTAEERQARLDAYEASKVERAAKRAAVKAQKEAQRATERATNPPHMAKVERAKERLPEMSKDVQEFFDTLVGCDKLSPSDIFILSENLNFYVRVERTKVSSGISLSVGDRVRIKSGSPRHIGSEGTVVKAQRIRCFVDVGGNKPVYLFNADVEVLGAAEIESVPSDSEVSTDEALEAATG